MIDLLHERGKRTFVDGKLYDVPQTVESAVRQLARAGAAYTTVHGTGPLLEAACRARDEAGGDLRILAVTVLTSLDKKDLIELGYGPDVEVESLVVERAGHALRLGCDGVIASGREARALREVHGDGFLIVSPGIRPVNGTTTRSGSSRPRPRSWPAPTTSSWAGRSATQPIRAPPPWDPGHDRGAVPLGLSRGATQLLECCGYKTMPGVCGV